MSGTAMSTESRTLWSETAQRAVLGSVLLDNGLMHAVELTEDDFFGPDRTLFRMMLQKWGDAEPFDPATIATGLNGQLQNVGGAAYLGDLIDSAVCDSGLLKSHAKTIRKFSRLRKLALLGENLTKGAWELTSDPECLLSTAERLVVQLRGEYQAEQWGRPDGLICLADVKPEPVNWLWEGRVPLSACTILDGDPSLGKTTIALDLAARVTVGEYMPDDTPAGAVGTVIFLSSEDVLANTIRPRLDAAGGDASKVFAFDPDTDLAPLTLPGDIARLESMIRARNVKLVIADPLVAYLGETINSHRDQDVRRALAPLGRMAERTGVAILGIRHLNKNGGVSALYRGGGSIAIIGAARSGLLVGIDPDDPESAVLAPTKHNLAKRPESLKYRVIEASWELNGGRKITVSKIAWRGTSERTAQELVGPPQNEDELSAEEEATEFLRQELIDGPKAAKQVQAQAKARGLSWRTVRRAKKKADVISRKDGYQGEWVLEISKVAKNSKAGQHKDMDSFEGNGHL
jgi:AAA domain/DnaB-like helicase N terminal domain